MRPATVTRYVAGVVTVLTAISLAVALWPTIGWQTPESHDHDIEASNQSVLSAIESLSSQVVGVSTQVAINHENWKCDEIVEELKELREAGGAGSVKETQLLAQFEETRCGRFSDLD